VTRRTRSTIRASARRCVVWVICSDWRANTFCVRD
jgi:hypothetical protein